MSWRGLDRSGFTLALFQEWGGESEVLLEQVQLNFTFRYKFIIPTSLVAWWSELLTTKHEVSGSIPGSTMCVFPCGEDAHGDHGLGSW